MKPRPLLIRRGSEFIINYLKNIEAGNETTDIRLEKVLRSHNIIVDADELVPSWNNSPNIKSLALYLIIDHNCNMACTYCLAGSKTYRRKQRMPLSVAKESLEKASPLITPNNTLEIVFFGGEPLLNSPAVFDIVDFVETQLKPKYPKIHFHYHVTTNLTVLNDDLILLFKEYNFTILTDIDGRKVEHNITRPFLTGKSSFDVTVKNVQKLIRHGVQVSVRCTVTSVNVDNLGQIYDYFKTLGVYSQSYPMLMPVDSDCSLVNKALFPEVQPYVDFIRKKLLVSLQDRVYLAPITEVVDQVIAARTQFFGCGLPMGYTAVVDAKGMVYPCIYLVGNKKYLLGSVFDENPFNFSFPQLSVDNIEFCRDCKLRYLCGGGCPLSELIVKDISIEALEYFHKVSCALAWTSFEEACWALVTGKVDQNTFARYKKKC